MGITYADVSRRAWEIHVSEKHRERAIPAPPENIRFAESWERVLAAINAIAALVLSGARTYGVFLAIGEASFGRGSPLAIIEAVAAIGAFDFGSVAIGSMLGRMSGKNEGRITMVSALAIAAVIAGGAGYLQTAIGLGNSHDVDTTRRIVMYAIGVLSIVYVLLSAHFVGIHMRKWDHERDRAIEGYADSVAEYNLWLERSYHSRKRELLEIAADELGYELRGREATGEKRLSLADQVRSVLAKNPEASVDDVMAALGLPDNKRGSVATTLSRIRKKTGRGKLESVRK